MAALDGAVHRSPVATCTLTLIDLHDPKQYDLLLRQRILCGWNKEPKFLDIWRMDMDKTKSPLFWISIPGQSEPVGHIGLTTELDPPELELANPDKSVAMLSRFFIYEAFRSGGIGRAAMQQVEAMAKVAPYGSPNCTAITLHTASRRYFEDDGPEWRGLYSKLLGPDALLPKGQGRSPEDWYERMGYVKWKEEPRYEALMDDGTPVKIVASFLRKDI